MSLFQSCLGPNSNISSLMLYTQKLATYTLHKLMFNFCVLFCVYRTQSFLFISSHTISLLMQITNSSTNLRALQFLILRSPLVPPLLDTEYVHTHGKNFSH